MNIRRLTSLAAAGALILAACGSNNSDSKTASAATAPAGTGSAATATTAAGGSAPGTGGKAIGFIFVGPKDDFGYNQAA
ncbi:MAG: hypothetical protein JWM12_2525, partial [Ilumatobacteraceae bacterium]|nr:hypothetical protein [Ilumatobacteraceae bacterium]